MAVGLLVNIDVDDLDRATAFYCDAFGLDIGRRFGGEVIELIGASSPIYLLSKPAGSAATSTTGQTRDYDRHWTPVHLDIVVPDIEAAVARAETAGARIESPVKTSSWGRLAMISDPFGHGLCLIEFIGRGYDEIAD
ncbi:VOC family protein [Kaustia mangrovi]|uniref:VOC family protein n=1 Tax=Kaustia mangrovi TaxID=2593653 RepID=A0A7S8C7W6_9HYPH|nr:VOC family protein [Kaustia mangrovi]QPC45024.1 VOC family protein [Kaustia mangrovi]